MIPLIRTILLLFLLVHPLIAAGPSAAGCLLKFENRMLVVKDIWSNRWSLPGGFIPENESPEKAAERETWEETGLSVTATGQIADLNGFALFACRASEPVHVFTSKDNTFRVPVPHWSRDEIDRIQLIDLAKVEQQHWRFPSQFEEVRNAFEWAQGVNNHFLEALPKQDPPTWIHMQLRVIDWLQEARFLDPWMHLFNFFGERYFFFILLPWILIGRYRNFGLKLAGIILFSGILNGVVKEFFQTPRPLHLWPSLELMSATGFGFPSGHTQVAATFFTLIGIKFRRFLPWCLAAAALTGLSRFYFGAHFLHDVAAGWIVGISLAYALFHKWHAILFFLLSVCLLVFRFHPDAVAVVAAFGGVMVGSRFSLAQNIGKIGYFIASVVTVAGMFLFPLILSQAFSSERTFLVMLTRQITIYLMLGLWLSMGTYFGPKLISWVTKDRNAPFSPQSI